MNFTIYDLLKFKFRHILKEKSQNFSFPHFPRFTIVAHFQSALPFFLSRPSLAVMIGHNTPLTLSPVKILSFIIVIMTMNQFVSDAMRAIIADYVDMGMLAPTGVLY